MEGVENVELHAGHHEVVQWLGLTFNMDTLIATWVTMAILGVIIVALVWYYGKQFNYTDDYHDDNENY